MNSFPYIKAPECQSTPELFCTIIVTIHGPLDRDSNGFCHYKSPAAMGKTHLKP